MFTGQKQTVNSPRTHSRTKISKIEIKRWPNCNLVHILWEYPFCYILSRLGTLGITHNVNMSMCDLALNKFLYKNMIQKFLLNIEHSEVLQHIPV